MRARMADFWVVVGLLKRTFVDLFRNWGVALRSAWLLIVPMALLIVWAAWAYKSGALLAYLPKHAGGGAEFPVLALCLGLLALIGTLPAAVNWHRFGLMGEVPSALRPRLNLGLSMGYLGRTVLLVLVAILITLPLVLLCLPIADKAAGGFSFNAGALPHPLTAKNVILSTLLIGLIYAFVMRWSLILPAGAIGRRMTFAESKAAASAKLGFFGFFLIGLFFHFAPMLVNGVLAELPLDNLGGLMLVPFILLFWFMFGIAFVTVLYDHCVKPPQQE